MKILYITTIGTTMNFFTRYIQSLLKEGHTVDIATNENASKVADCYREWGCKVYSISCTRSPLNKGTFKAIKEIRAIVKDGGYELVHCHTPIAAMCTRLACKKLRKSGVKVIYTAHGFHFYKGAPKKNWMLFYTIEKLCARHTDVLITINREDYALAERKMKAKRIAYVPGVGIDLEKFSQPSVTREDKRRELGIPDSSTLLLSVGELNQNKNHETVIRAIANMENVRYLIAGKGGLDGYLQGLIDELGMTDRVQLLGYRSDIRELLIASDVFVFPSYREGLSVSVMEAMASGLSVVCSRIRGNTDLVDEKGGAHFNPHSVEDCRNAIESVLSADMSEHGKYNKEKIKAFSCETVDKLMREIYSLK